MSIAVRNADVRQVCTPCLSVLMKINMTSGYSVNRLAALSSTSQRLPSLERSQLLRLLYKCFIFSCNKKDNKEMSQFYSRKLVI